MRLKEDIFYKGAKEYARKYGSEQLELAERLNAENEKTPGDGASRIIDIFKARSKKRNLKIASAAAAACACAVLAVVIPITLSKPNNEAQTASVITAYDAVEEELPAEDAATESAAAAVPAENAGYEQSESTQTAKSNALQNYSGAFRAQVSQAMLKLPANFTLKSVNEDNGAAVLNIENDAGDDVTLIVSGNSADNQNNADLTEYELNGIYAYGAAYPDYSYLTYQKDGIRFDLTSKYELSTLLDLVSSIES